MRKIPTAKIAAHRSDLVASSSHREQYNQARNSTSYIMMTGRGRATWVIYRECISLRTIVNKSQGEQLARSSPDICNWVLLNGSRGHFDIYRIRVPPISVFDLVFSSLDISISLSLSLSLSFSLSWVINTEATGNVTVPSSIDGSESNWLALNLTFAMASNYSLQCFFSDRTWAFNHE